MCWGFAPAAFCRTYRLVGCDAATRTWYAERGVEQPPTEDVPVDNAARLAQTALLTGPKKANHGACRGCLSLA